MIYVGRGGGIRTPDPLLPKQMRYQTALRPDRPIISTRRQPGPGSRAAAHPTVSLQRRRHRRASRPQDPAPLPGFQPVGITGRLDGAARHSSRHPWENPANLCQDRGRGLAPPPALPLRFQLAGCYNQERYGGYSSVAERRSVAADVVGSTPTGRPNSPDHLLPLREDPLAHVPVGKRSVRSKSSIPSARRRSAIASGVAYGSARPGSSRGWLR